MLFFFSIKEGLRSSNMWSIKLQYNHFKKKKQKDKYWHSLKSCKEDNWKLLDMQYLHVTLQHPQASENTEICPTIFLTISRKWGLLTLPTGKITAGKCYSIFWLVQAAPDSSAACSAGMEAEALVQNWKPNYVGSVLHALVILDYQGTKI